VKRSLLATFLASACAHAPEGPPHPPTSPAPVPAPSSILAVLAHRDELGLDDRQAARLVEMQQQLERKNAETRQRVASTAPKASSRDGARGEGRPPRQRGAPGRSGAARQPGPADRDEALTRALDDNAPRAFLRTEAVFTEGQRARARDLAEKYREDFEDRRERAKREAEERAR